MPAQTDIPVAANILGVSVTADRNACNFPSGDISLTAVLLALLLIDYWHDLWCVQLLPQIWTNWRTKKTDGLPAIMMYIWALCGVPFGVYAIVQKFNMPIQVQPQCFMALCLVSWSQILHYGHGYPVWKAAGAGVGMACIFAGVEAALILTLTPIYHRGNETPILVIGIVAAVLLAVGLLPPYQEIWKRHGRVIGFNWIFLGMDWGGAFFSLMALVAQNTFDVTGGVVYIICCFLEVGIFASHIVWRIRTRKLRKAAAAEGKTFDDVLAEYEARGEPFHWADRKWRWGGSKSARKTTVGDEELGEAGRAAYAPETGYAEEETGYATEDKYASPSEPDSPVALGFPPGMAVERTIDGKMHGEA
ncbi:hypothetical protein GE09DRAFT_763407 [Coniochaeta sp. 2T2.1]|nr:hypothetical protein GE09DRAFT_763407 [Coniochaeta sp. 2T2.1]